MISPGLAPIPVAVAVPQETETDTFWSWLWQTAQEPGVMELLVLLPVLLVGLLLLVHALRMAGQVRQRAALSDYLLGVEQALSGDLPGAKKRLERVLAQDPENHYARLLHGVVLAELGEAAEAHKQHLYLQRAFQVQSSDNDLALARTLLAVGRPNDAAAAAGRALETEHERPAALRVLFRAQLAAGLPADAGATGERLARLLPADEQGEVRRRAAAALALAGAVHLRSGSRGEAGRLLSRALTLDKDVPEVRRLQAGLDGLRLGTTQMLRQLTEGPTPERETLPVPTRGHILVQVREPGAAQSPGVRALTSLIPRSRWRCGACQGEVRGPQAVCPHCGSEGQVHTLEPALFADVDSATLLMDDIDETRAHVRRLMEAAFDGDEEAREDLLEMGGKAVVELLAAAIKRGEEDDTAISILQAMGPAIIPELFSAYEKSDRALLPLPAFFGGRSTAGVVGRIVQGFGVSALPHFEGLLDSENRDLRKITIDFFIGLADQREFQRILDRFPPMEVMHRLNKAESQALIRFLGKVEPDSFVSEGLLPDSAFYRDVELFEAIPSAQHPDELKRILQVRGSNRGLTLLLIQHLGDDPQAPAAEEVLRHFGIDALDHMLAAFTDPDCPESVSKSLGTQIQRIGAAAVDKICACFGPRASALDKDLEQLLLNIGAEAIAPLEKNYEHGGLLKYLGSLGKRHNNRRERIIRALLGIGTAKAHQVLEDMRSREKDADLKLRLSQALHELERRGSTTRGGHGQAG